MVQVSGRKCKQESRAIEFRQKLIAWNATPTSLRPSLRAVARELGTSHQLLKRYLDRLEQWELRERSRNAKKASEEIRARADAKGRPMTDWEEQQVHAYTQEAFHAMVTSVLLDALDRLKRESKRGALNRHQIKMLTVFARNGLSGAQDLLQNCVQSNAKNRIDNLPAISSGAAKSFRSVGGKAKKDWQLR
jgi:predicted ArsR family transcriptional regulator